MRRARQFFEFVRRQILHHELESAELPQALNRRRQRRKHDRPLDAKQHRTYPIHDCRGRMHVALALRIRLQWYENQSLIRRRPRKTEPSHRECSFGLLYSASMPDTCFPIAFVYSSDAPDGAWITMMKYP